jgi:hypothetical protein
VTPVTTTRPSVERSASASFGRPPASQDGRARLIGAIRQELLPGIRDPAQFEQLKTYLRAFSDEPASAINAGLAASLEAALTYARVIPLKLFATAAKHR